MRLLDSTTLEFKEFTGEKIPPYAILSHTWREKELSFQDMQCRYAHKKEYDKVKNFCKAAACHGFGYVWMDTCCIDKTSSSELSEAINSMYRWYQEAEVCYVYLSDVPSDADPCKPDSKFSRSRWFTRGWTLQELIAPSSVRFFGSDWEEIGTKWSLHEVISEITGIHANILLGDDLESVSIAQRMSWASTRKTTRLEDLAYCLMGIFGVNMPMLYGEGERAFIRLQEEIMKISDDHSIFAWKSNDWWSHDGGLLATSPAAFIGSGDIIRSSQVINSSSFTVTNKGIHLQLPLIPQNQPKTSLAVLNCQRIGKDDQLLGIMLRGVPETEESFERDLTYEIKTIDSIERTRLDLTSVYVRHKRLARQRSTAASYNQCSIKTEEIEKHGFFLCETYPTDCWIKPDGVTSEMPYHDDIFGAIKFANSHGYAFAVILKKKGKLLCANVITNVRSEPLKEIVLSLCPDATQSECRGREWENESDRIVRPYLSGRICVAIRKQILFRQKHFVIDISVKDTSPNGMRRQRLFTI